MNTKAVLIASIYAAYGQAVRLNSLQEEETEQTIQEIYNEYAGEDGVMNYDEFLQIVYEQRPGMDYGSAHAIYLWHAGEDQVLQVAEFEALVAEFPEGVEGDQGKDPEIEEMIPELFEQYAGDDNLLSQEEFIALYFDPQVDGPLSEEQLATIYQANAGTDGMTYDQFYQVVWDYVQGGENEDEYQESEYEYESGDEGEEGDDEGEDGDEEGEEGSDEGEEGEEGDDEGEEGDEEAEEGDEGDEEGEQGEEGENDGEDADCTNPIGGVICDAQLQRLFTKNDTDNDGKLTYNDWLTLYFDPTFDGPASEQMLMAWFNATAGSDQLLSYDELVNLISIYGSQMAQTD